MKAHTAVNVLRAARSRFEFWGIIQLGPQEFVALEFAFTKTENPALKELINNGVSGINRMSKAMFMALREGYKALEKAEPTEEFNIMPDGSVKASAEPKEGEPIPDWMKKLEDSLKNFNPEDFKENGEDKPKGKDDEPTSTDEHGQA